VVPKSDLIVGVSVSVSVSRVRVRAPCRFSIYGVFEDFWCGRTPVERAVSMLMVQANEGRSAEILSLFFSLGCMQLGQVSPTVLFPSPLLSLVRYQVTSLHRHKC
jgi:hypothetical protein